MLWRSGSTSTERLGRGGVGGALVALGYGVYFVNRMLPVYVAHGRTRREFAANLAVFLAGVLPGVAVTWALVRDIPIRNRLA